MFERPTILVLIGACVIGLFAWLTAASPSYSFHPFCTYGEIYKLNATIEVDGQAYSSEVVRQTTKSRDWIYNLNSNGCAATHGTALSFRLPDNSVVLLRATLCLNGIAALKKAHKIDVAQYCDSVHINRPSRNPGRYADGYIVNDAEQPAFWTRLWFGAPATENKTVVRLTSVSAQNAHQDAHDDLEKTAPGLLKASFSYKDLYNRPDEIIPYPRRSASYPPVNGRFLYDVKER